MKQQRLEDIRSALEWTPRSVINVTLKLHDDIINVLRHIPPVEDTDLLRRLANRVNEVEPYIKEMERFREPKR